MTPTISSREPVLAFDGDCGFCQAVINRISTRGRPALNAVPWQFLPQEVTQPHLHRLDREVLLLLDGKVIAGGADALGEYLGSSSSYGYRTAGSAIKLPVLRRCARGIYRWVARNRHRMPAGTPSCAVPITRS
ncbi:thiol-disulfide oxidoreductase DCC family protein [Streptomyces sp. NPDC001678]|uniref:thiol-disulfide oxidoreductase DCC family protein n=1 Tax=Streptomyces sp. NPDC001678 TaxID=3364599 RepID=UPI00369672D9